MNIFQVMEDAERVANTLTDEQLEKVRCLREGPPSHTWRAISEAMHSEVGGYPKGHQTYGEYMCRRAGAG